MRKILLFALLATLGVSCVQDSVEEQRSNIVADNKIYASIGDLEADTRVELNSSKQTVWTEGDQITVFHSKDVEVWGFDGKTGDRSGSFSYLASYNYQNSNIDYKNKYYALYLADLIIAYYNDGTPAFSTTVPSVQYYKEQSYGLNTNAMLGVSNDGKTYKFKNLMSYIRLSLTGDKVVKSITLSDNSTTPSAIAGSMYVNIDGSVLWNTSQDNHTDTIILDCGDGVQLSSMPTDFYFTLPPVELSGGISVVVTFDDGTIFPKSTTNSIILERNTIQPMRTFDTSGDVDWQNVVIQHSGEWVSFPWLYGSSAITGYVYWGDGYMSALNSAEKYVYYDGELEHTITIESQSALQFSMESCAGVSEIDFSNF